MAAAVLMENVAQDAAFLIFRASGSTTTGKDSNFSQAPADAAA
jgi:hypothetical protein